LDALLAYLVEKLLLDSSVGDVEEADIQKGVSQLFQESRLCSLIAGQREVEDWYFLERHFAVSKDCLSSEC